MNNSEIGTNKKYKILFVHHVSEIGGASFCLLNIINGLDRTIFEPIVMLRSLGPLSEELKKLDVPIFYLPSLWTFPYNKSLLDPRNLSSAIAPYRSFDEFEKLVLEISPDMLYLNNSLLFPYLNISKKNRIKGVIHIREHWPLNEHKKQLKFIQNQILSKADSIIAINNYSAKMISPTLEKTTIVYDWIDMDSRYDNLDIQSILKEDVSTLKVFVFTGGNNWIKGNYEVVKAFHEEVKAENARLLALGLTPGLKTKGIKSKLKYILSKFGFKFNDHLIQEFIKKDNRIICIPSNYNISRLLEQSYCNLSFFKIPHANLALAECEILMTPSIAAATPESVEYSINGDLASLYPINDYKAFVQAIKELDDKYDNLKNKLKGKGYLIKLKFDKTSNINLLNKTLLSIFDS